MESSKQSSWVLVLIGCGKLLKATVLVLIAREAHRLLLAPATADTFAHWVRIARVDPGNHYVHRLISTITGISPRRLAAIRVGSYIYASIFAIEGMGLVLRQRWAEYMTVISTSLLLPLEIFELFHGHHQAVKITVLLANAAIVVYLIARLRKDAKRQSV